MSAENQDSKPFEGLDTFLMRSIYWKIFISFWIATILTILTVVWVTGHFAQSASNPKREHVFMDSYANAAVTTYEYGKVQALNEWIKHTDLSQHMQLYLIESTGHIINQNAPILPIIKKTAKRYQNKRLQEGINKQDNLIISHEIVSSSQKKYRLAAITDKPLSQFIAIEWAGLTIRIILAVFISGFICYFLSIYLTKPIRVLQYAARDLAKGKLETRVRLPKSHLQDEISSLAEEFNDMATQIGSLLKSKERLLQDISHELRSPLARIQIAAELLKKRLSEPSSEIERIDTECEKLNLLIGEILDFARIGARTSSDSFQPVDFSMLITEICSDANFEFGMHQQRVFFKNTGPIKGYGIPKLLHRAIENILRNALRYSPANKPVSISLYQDFSGKTVIDIEDEGPGVPEHELDAIFNPFYRVDPSRENKTGGFGLGLTIAKEAISLHHGQINAFNRPKGGLLVRIILDN